MKFTAVFRDFANALKMIIRGSTNFSGEMWKFTSQFQNDIAVD
jgi:hypothetical protein